MRNKKKGKRFGTIDALKHAGYYYLEGNVYIRYELDENDLIVRLLKICYVHTFFVFIKFPATSAHVNSRRNYMNITYIIQRL